ncbi:hypothetical protein BAZSYMA_ACONTIG22223_0 [Bathymodiolus azoricus thioautotrophic gill symbiont]|uniref:Uncharacterized protein n=1 Tax=Bathymodiolus azoricus thioautotrophic gill symbiont TaxID=235205 RepID=A0A1H6LP64_9GAMM|nr:hypothetical protein BAZSYMA_ACONTIG22223_0 [Bathymodiolus azoricus thioautotrophic gill symbiont]
MVVQIDFICVFLSIIIFCLSFYIEMHFFDHVFVSWVFLNGSNFLILT